VLRKPDARVRAEYSRVVRDGAVDTFLDRHAVYGAASARMVERRSA
jgi:hypothetical protein